MKMIWAVIQAGSAHMVVDALEKSGIHAMTRLDVTGFDKGQGIPAGPAGYIEMPREMLMIMLADHDVAKAVIAIRTAAKTCSKDDPDAKIPATGKIFVTYVEDFYTIRTADRNIAGRMLHEKDYCNHPE